MNIAFIGIGVNAQRGERAKKDKNEIDENSIFEQGPLISHGSETTHRKGCAPKVKNQTIFKRIRSHSAVRYFLRA